MNKIECFFYVQSSFIEVFIYNYESKLKIFNKRINTDFDFHDSENFIKSNDNLLKNLIIEIEKKIENSINFTNLIIESPLSYEISASIKKNFDKSTISKEQIEYLIQDLKHQVSKSNINFKISHIVINEYLLNGVKIDHAPINKQCEDLTINAKFIFIKKNIVLDLEKFFRNHQIELKSILCANYVKSSMNYGFKNIFEAGLSLTDGFNKNEVFISSKKPVKLGFFEKMFHMLS